MSTKVCSCNSTSKTLTKLHFFESKRRQAESGRKCGLIYSEFMDFVVRKFVNFSRLSGQYFNWDFNSIWSSKILDYFDDVFFLVYHPMNNELKRYNNELNVFATCRTVDTAAMNWTWFLCVFWWYEREQWTVFQKCSFCQIFTGRWGVSVMTHISRFWARHETLKRGLLIMRKIR